MNFKDTAEKNKVLEIRVGSHLFGTNTPDSDLDLFGIYMPSEEMVYGDLRCEEVDLSVIAKDSTGRNTAEAIDRKFHEYRKFVRLALQNNPNILHVLFANNENIVYLDEQTGFGRNLLNKAYVFPHKGAHHRFIQYADAQRHKMRIKPENYAQLEKGLEILMGEDDHKVIGELRDVAPFHYEGKGKHVKLGDVFFEAGTFVKKARRAVEERLSKATSRAQLFTKYGYDVKYASNLIQLLLEGIELMQTGAIAMPLTYGHYVLEIKNGKFSAEQIMNHADPLVEEAREAYNKSELPTEPRTKEITEFMISEVKRFLVS